jgi:glycine/D-amino acid oxidase-like deaminating enzyme
MADQETAPCVSVPSRPILVVGAGAAGIGCAIAAANGGSEVILVERDPTVGGTVAKALIHTIGGLFDDAGMPINAELTDDLRRRLSEADPGTVPRRMGRVHVLSTDPRTYQTTLARWLDETPRARVLTGTSVLEQLVGDRRIERVRLRGAFGTETVHPAAVVDATGDAGIVRRIDPDLVEPGCALAGLVTVLRGLEPEALAFPHGVALAKEIAAAVDTGVLPSECARLWPDQGVMPGEAYLKFNLRREMYKPERMRQVVDALIVWLRRLPGLTGVHLHRMGQIGVRDGGRVRGEYRLTEDDLTSGRRFPDAVCQGCWPIEHWDPGQDIRLRYLPPGTRYDIPLRAMKVRGFSNLYAAGKCLSAEPRAQASARIAGTCWSMGSGLGRMLAGGAAPSDARRAPGEPSRR